MPVYSKNKYNQTLMHLAAAGGHVEVLKTLTNEHAKINVRDRNDRTPLYLAAGNGHKAAVQHLMEKMAAGKEFEESRDQPWLFSDESTFLDVAIENNHGYDL